MKNHNVLVCPIAYNENVKLKSVIERFLSSCVKNQVDYLVIDDSSDDGTTELIESYKDKGVQTIRHKQRSGVGAGIRTAIRHAQKEGYEVLVIMAGNDKDNPNEIPHVINPILNDGFDFIQGSRYKNKDGSGGDMPFYRKVGTRLHPFFMGLITGRKLTDTTNGFRAIRLSLFDDKRINIDQSWLDTYELEPYILYKAIKCGYKYDEASVTKIYPPKKLGYTKMTPKGWWGIIRPLLLLGLGLKK